MSTVQSTENDSALGGEEHLVEQLATLEKLQDQLDELRALVPNLIAPFTATQDTPAALIRDFKQTAITEAKRLQAFERSWKSDDIQNVLASAARSIKSNPNLAMGVSIAPYGWVQRVRKQQRLAQIKTEESHDMPMP